MTYSHCLRVFAILGFAFGLLMGCKNAVETESPEVSLVVRAATTYTGLPFGLNNPPNSLRGKDGLTGTYQGLDFKYLLPRLREATKLKFSYIMVMPRWRQTLHYLSNDAYSVKNTWKSIDSLLKYFPADSMRKYVANGTLRGYSIMDDMGCQTCWGKRGVTVSGAQADSVYWYARAKIPVEVPLGIRVQPSWLVSEGSAGTSRYLDFAWLQHVAAKGDIKTWYDKETKIAQGLPHPLRLAYGLNAYHYHKDDSPITATELKNGGIVAVTYPGSCFSSSWRWWSGWRDANRGPVWDYLANLAAQQTNVPSCKAA